MNRFRARAGFTLIEILVVIFIVMTVLTIGLLSFGILGDDESLQDEARRFAALNDVALDEATLQGREFGVEILNAGYRFVEFDPLTALWADVPGDDTLRLRSLPADLELELYLEDKRILLDDNPAPFEDPNKSASGGSLRVYAPHLLLYSSGDTTPFELHIVQHVIDQRVRLRGNAIGAIEILDRDAE